MMNQMNHRRKNNSRCNNMGGGTSVIMGLVAGFMICCCQPLLSFGFVVVPSSTTTSSMSSSTPMSLQQHHRHHHQRMMVANPASFHSDEEWHPHDPAFSTPQLLSGLWHQIAQAGTMAKGETYTIVYPQMEEDINKPRYLNLLLSHLDVCKDVCDHFGISTTLVPYLQKGKIVGFTAKSFATKRPEDDYDFAYDPFWDDGTDFESLYAGIDDEYDEKEDVDDSAKEQRRKNRKQLPDIKVLVPDDDDEMINITKTWVGKMMADMGVCPFTMDATRAGLPVGNIFYCVDRSTTPEDMYARYWKEVVRVEQQKEKDLSTTLLIIPEFYMENVELFENFCNTLTTALTALQVEDLLQLVFFHPQFSFRDGSARAGDGQAANYARRSPWPMINLLRTKQVRAAQKGIPTGLVYKQNEKTLSSIGADQLETMLRLRDWTEIEDMKVNRREMDALKIAQDFQSTGSLKDEDISLEHDTTPAANKVDRRQVEQGNLINVLLQALDKRLGKGTSAEGRLALSGPETSASAMAVDFLLQELEKKIVASSSTTTIPTPAAAAAVSSETKPSAAATATSDDGESEAMQLARRERERQERLAAAKRMMMQELAGDDEEPVARNMNEILFGKGGIAEEKDDEGLPRGLSDW